MRLPVLIWCIIIAPYTFNVCAMGRGGSSSNSSGINNQLSMDSVIASLALADTFLSQLTSVTEGLRQQNALNVATLQAILNAADSPWKSGAVQVIEKMLTYTPAFGLPYLERAAEACHTEGADFIRFLNGQQKKGKSFSNLLHAVRYGMRHLGPNREPLNHYLSAHQEDINSALNHYHALLSALADGVRATHASLATRNTPSVHTQSLQPDSLVHGQDDEVEFDAHDWVLALQQYDDWWIAAYDRPMLRVFAGNNNDNDDDDNPIAEFNRIHTELCGVDMERMRKGPRWEWEQE